MAREPDKYNLPIGYSLLQTMLHSREFLADPVKFITKSMVKFSGTYTATLGLQQKLIITQDPGFINYVLKENHTNYHKSAFAERAKQFFGNGLLFSNGDYWLQQRRLVQPAFHREKLRGLSDIITKTISEFLATFPTGNSIDIYPLAYRLSFNILIQSLFDIKLWPGTMLELSQLFTDLQDFLIKDIYQPFRKFLYPVNGAEKIQIKKAQRLRSIFQTIVVERRKSPAAFSDLLDMLLSSTYEDTGEPMSDDQVIDEALILIFAGHETTANTLSWLLYLLAENETVQEQLAVSVKQQAAPDSLTNIYLQAVINETMRLYPAAWMTERVTLTDDGFGDHTYRKGTIIIPFFFGMHRDEKYWKEAAAFQPERFIADGKLLKHKNYFPFGAGPRMCIGNNFAMAEMSFFISAFLQQFRITTAAQTPAMNALITLRPDKVVLNIERRPHSTQ